MISIGIDFGTTNSCIEVFRDNEMEIIANENGNRFTPSIVAFTNEGILIGDSAKDQIKRNPTNTIYDIKRFLGRTYNDPSVQKDISKYPFKILSDEKNMIQIEVELEGKTKLFYPEEITALLLSKLKKDAENYLNEKVTEVVISVPAFYNNRQRQAMMNAAQIAEIKILRLINDPTAVSLSITLTQKSDIEKKIFIVDIGGGTFDSSIVCIVDDFVEVRATSGCTNLGGEDFNEELFQYMINFLNEKHPELKVENSPEKMRDIRDLCEQAKIKLSKEMLVNVDLSSLFEGKDIQIGISQALFDGINEKNYKIISERIEKVFKDCRDISFEDINDIYIVGGSSRIPGIKKLIQKYFNGKKPSEFYIEPDEIVAYGAALYYNEIKKEQISGEITSIILDVTPITFGTQKSSDIFISYIPRNMTCPVKKQHTFSTFCDDQTEIEINLFEGESRYTYKNDWFDTVVISNIPPAKRNQPQLDVTFDYDYSCIMSATVKGRMYNFDGPVIEGLVLKHLKRGFLTDEEVQILKEKFKLLKIIYN